MLVDIDLHRGLGHWSARSDLSGKLITSLLICFMDFSRDRTSWALVCRHLTAAHVHACVERGCRSCSRRRGLPMHDLMQLLRAAAASLALFAAGSALAGCGGSGAASGIGTPHAKSPITK